MQTTLFEALNHGADGNLFDSEQVLALLNGTVQLQYSVTRTDATATDHATATVDLITAGGSVFSFDDDGPLLTVEPRARRSLRRSLTRRLVRTATTPARSRMPAATPIRMTPGLALAR